VTPPVTGMAIPDKSNFKVFPTCFDELLHIQSDKTNCTISVYNQLGICLKSIKPETNNLIISLSGWPSGMYLVQEDKHDAVKIFKK
jgi:hypothetical protein